MMETWKREGEEGREYVKVKMESSGGVLKKTERKVFGNLFKKKWFYGSWCELTDSELARCDWLKKMEFS